MSHDLDHLRWFRHEKSILLDFLDFFESLFVYIHGIFIRINKTFSKMKLLWQAYRVYVSLYWQNIFFFKNSIYKISNINLYESIS